jgi:hypothetical protein
MCEAAGIRCVGDAVNGTWEWEIKNASMFFREIKCGNGIESGLFRMHGHWWGVSLYIDGDSEETKNNVSFYLYMAKHGIETMDRCRAKWMVQLIGNQENISRETDDESIFVNGKPRAFRKFLERDRLGCFILPGDIFCFRITIITDTTVQLAPQDLGMVLKEKYF